MNCRLPMRYLAALWLFLIAVPGLAETPRWEFSLEKGGLQSFDRQATAVWMKQQGVLFLTPEWVLVYQVNRTARQAELGQRGASGGAGNFFLSLKVLSAQDGRVIKSMNLPTSASLSHVLATRGGSFLVRTGNMLYLYSPAFEQLAARELPLAKEAPNEDWQVRVSPVGEKVVLFHEQVFTTAEILPDNSVLHDGKAKVDVLILNAETLAQERAFTLSHTLPFWAPGDEVLISSNPAHSYTDGQVGTLNFNGEWSPLTANFLLDRTFCRYNMTTASEERVVLLGCETFTVMSMTGERLYSRHDARYVFVSALAAGSYLAVQCDRYRMEQIGLSGGASLGTRVDRIEVFDLDTRQRRLSVPIRGDVAYYAVSPQGALAIVDGGILHVYAVDSHH